MKKDDKIIELFKKHKDLYLSGEEVSQKLNISRQALWKHIEKLREMGYIIEAVPHLGYKLMHAPNKIVAPEIKWNLKTKFIGKEIHSYESVGSTNTIAYELAEKGSLEGTCVIANEQTKGKGRLGRKWASPAEGGIYLSCILRPDILPNEVPKITLVAAVSAARAIRDFSGLPALIKWPNDIMISDKKAGGILTELRAEMDKVDFLILGIGINVNTESDRIPAGGTSIKAESSSSGDYSRPEFVRVFLTELEREYDKFKKKGFLALREELKSLSCTIGRNVSVKTSANGEYKGKALDINEDGALLVENETGKKKAFMSGDVTLAR